MQSCNYKNTLLPLIVSRFYSSDISKQLSQEVPWI